MLLSIMGKLEEVSEDFKDFLTKDGNRYVIVVIFVVLILVFLLGFNAMHKNDK